MAEYRIEQILTTEDNVKKYLCFANVEEEDVDFYRFLVVDADTGKSDWKSFREVIGLLKRPNKIHGVVRRWDKSCDFYCMNALDWAMKCMLKREKRIDLPPKSAKAVGNNGRYCFIAHEDKPEFEFMDDLAYVSNDTCTVYNFIRDAFAYGNNCVLMTEYRLYVEVDERGYDVYKIVDKASFAKLLLTIRR